MDVRWVVNLRLAQDDAEAQDLREADVQVIVRCPCGRRHEVCLAPEAEPSDAEKLSREDSKKLEAAMRARREEREQRGSGRTGPLSAPTWNSVDQAEVLEQAQALQQAGQPRQVAARALADHYGIAVTSAYGWLARLIGDGRLKPWPAVDRAAARAQTMAARAQARRGELTRRFEVERSADVLDGTGLGI